MAEDVHKVGDVAQKLMASIGDDPDLEGCKVLDVGIVAAIEIPPGHDDHAAAEGLEQYPAVLYRVACSDTRDYVKAGLFGQAMIAAANGEALDDPEPPA